MQILNNHKWIIVKLNNIRSNNGYRQAFKVAGCPKYNVISI